MHLIGFKDLVLVTCLFIWVCNSVEEQLCDDGTCWTW